jgi:hypothetical protein
VVSSSYRFGGLKTTQHHYRTRKTIGAGRAGIRPRFGILAPTPQPRKCIGTREHAGQAADSASGGFVRQVPRLPVPREKRAGQAACRWAAAVHMKGDYYDGLE